MKKIIVAGNWKMNKTYLEAKQFIAQMNQKSSFGTEVILGVPALYSDTLYANNQKENVHIALQNCSDQSEGAFTGEISARMIASLAVKYCIVGHSERRTIYSETDELVNAKIKQLLDSNVRPIFCLGETLSERESNQTFLIVERQLNLGLKDLSNDDVSNIVIAYEPVWAIGTGITASKEQAEEVHAFIANYLKEKYGSPLASTIPILYGGSCNEKNALELFSQPNIWGGLIGGASLQFDVFEKIITTAENINNEG
jgi:triosephosphate isomerase